MWARKVGQGGIIITKVCFGTNHFYKCISQKYSHGILYETLYGFYDIMKIAKSEKSLNSVLFRPGLQTPVKPMVYIGIFGEFHYI